MKRAGVGLVVLAMVCGLGTMGASSIAVAAPGDIDLRFGDRGRVVPHFGERFELAVDVAALPDGRFAVLGNATRPQEGRKIVVAVFHRDGKLDRSFGHRGSTMISVTPWNEARALAVQPDGRIVIVGEASETGLGSSDVLVIRTMPNGSLDPSFGSGGVVTTGFPEPDPYNSDDAWDVLLQPDQRILVTGRAQGRPVLLRYLQNGALDLSFSDDGAAEPPPNSGRGAWQYIELLPDGRIITGGIRYLPNGTLDTSWSLQDDWAECTFTEDVAIAPDGDILASGGIGCRPNSQDPSDPAATISRYTADGVPDPGFADDGHFVVRGSESFFGPDLLFHDGQPLLIAGTLRRFLPRQEDFLVMRFRRDGKPDKSFSDGRATIDFGHSELARSGVILGRRLVVVGTTAHAGKVRFAVAAYDLGRGGKP